MTLTEAVTTVSPSPQCQLDLADKEQTLNTIKSHTANGPPLIEYTLTLNSTSSDDVITTSDGIHNFKLFEWKRVFTRHGQALLSLPYNYKVLSLSLLSYGIIAMDVELVDMPYGCFSNLTSDEKVKQLRDLVMYNFDIPSLKAGSYLQEGDQACHMIIRNNSYGVAEFVYNCCTITETTKTVYCKDHVKSKWFLLLFNAIPWMDIIFFFFFPMFALGIISRRSYRTTNYIVKLKEPHVTTIKKDMHDNEDMEMIDIGPKKKKKKSKNTTWLSEIVPILSKESKRFIKRNLVKNRLCIDNVRKLPLNRPITVKMPLLHILVDHKQLMAEKDVNIGLLQFIWRNVFLCGMKRDYPFITCCKQSFIFGSWKRKLFCCPFPKIGLTRKLRQLNRQARRYCSWQTVFALLSFVAIVILIPFPYYIQIILYNKFAKHEITARISAANAVNLSLNPPFYQAWRYFEFVPFATLQLIGLIMYFVTSVILLVLYKKNTLYFIEYLVAVLRDFKHLERIETFRMLALHFVTPFEKLGLLGCLVGPVIWIISLPFCLLAIAYYCIPTVYLTGRLLFLRKPSFVMKLMFHSKTHSEKYTSSLKEEKKIAKRTKPEEDDSDTEDDDPNLDSLEKILLLQRISPSTDDFIPIRPLRKDGTLKAVSIAGYKDIERVVIGIVVVLWMVGLLIIYSEFFGFIVEVLTLTFMGAIANAGSVGQYFFFTFFVVTYTRTVLNKVNEKYQKMLSELFSHIKEKLSDELAETCIIRGSEQKNFAFKFFSKAELRELNNKRQLSMISDVQDDFADIYKDRFETQNKKLQLNLHSLILFLDKFDNPRIPKELFDRVCKIKCPGCPGPIYKSLLMALKELAYLVLFLFFVILVVLAFGDAYEISTTNQLLLTVVGGFAPFVVRFVMKPKSLHVNFSTYSFKGKVHEIISSYRQSWPVYDIEFNLSADDGGADTEGGAETVAQQCDDESQPKRNDTAAVLEVTDETVLLSDNKPVSSTPEPHNELTSGMDNNNTADNPRANIYRFQIDENGDLVFHMRSIKDDEPEQDLFVMAGRV